MVDDVYISGVYQMGSEIGDKLGAKTKWHGADWPVDSFFHPAKPETASAAVQQSARGEPLVQDLYPEGVAVWDEKAFSKARDFLFLSGFLTVSEKVAVVMRRFDLGGGKLVPVPLLKADLETPWPEPFYYINYGGPKDTFLPEQSRSIQLQILREAPKKSTYSVHSPSDLDVALLDSAREGADIWIEQYVRSKLFLSSSLVDALHAANIDIDVRLAKCRIVEG